MREYTVKVPRRASRITIHKILMDMVTNTDLDPEAPRASAQMTWRYQPRTSIATVRVGDHVTLRGKNILSGPVTVTPPSAGDTITVTMDALYNRMRYLPRAMQQRLGVPRGRGTRTPIPRARREEIILARLERKGITAENLTIIAGPHVRRSHKAKDGQFPTLSISFTTKDTDAVRTLWENGFGRGKNYGLGMFH